MNLNTDLRGASPNTVLGREAELEILRHAYESVKAGSPALVQIAGRSGAGKTALVRKFFEDIAVERPFIIFGKHEQHSEGIPYRGFSEAVRYAAYQILSVEKSALTRWKRRIEKALKENVPVISGLVSEFEHLFPGRRTQALQDPEKSKNRFENAFTGLVSVFASAEAPFVFFLDDLQWTDPASLNLIKQTAAKMPLQAAAF